MLRILVLVLVAANLLFFGWSRGWLDGMAGVRAGGDREPERLSRQVRPDTVKVIPPANLAAVAALAGGVNEADGGAGVGAGTVTNPGAAAGDLVAGPPACLEAGPVDADQLAAAEAAVRAEVPRGQWSTVRVDRPGAWLVYLGRFATPEALARKERELQRRKLDYVVIASPPELDPGLSLGRFDDRVAADQALAQFTRLGLQAPRVVEIEAPATQQLFRVEKADAALAGRLAALKVDALGTGFSACVER